MPDLYVKHPIIHDGHKYTPGDKFPSDTDEILLDHLHKKGILMTEAEANPITVNDLLNELRAENATLRAEIEALKEPLVKNSHTK